MVGLEIFEECFDVCMVVVCMGGGGFFGGIVMVVKGLCLDVCVVGI